jgi:FkbM family methyltransferase
MSVSQQLLRASAYKVLPRVPSGWAHWLRHRVILRSVLKKLSINCVLDVGANRGQYGTMLRRIGYDGWILSFEPVRANYELLQAEAANWERWRVFPFALGEEAERRTINVTAETVFSSFLDPREESQARFRNNRVERREIVDVKRLDAVLDECLTGIESPRIYLKLDTQGFDLEVMAGAKKVLPRILGLQTEVALRSIYHGMRSFAESVGWFQTNGFEVIDFVTVNRDVDDLCAIEMDCIMARRPEWKSVALIKKAKPGRSAVEEEVFLVGTA